MYRVDETFVFICFVLVNNYNDKSERRKNKRPLKVQLERWLVLGTIRTESGSEENEPETSIR